MTRGKDSYFNLFIDDFLGGVADLTAEERGVYITLLCLMYDRDDGMLYDNDRRWAHRNNMSTRKYRIIKNKLLTEGKLCIVQRDTEPFLTNDRVLSEQKTRQTMKDKNANSGRIGGIKTAENKRKPNEINGTIAAPALASGNGKDAAYQLHLQQEEDIRQPDGVTETISNQDILEALDKYNLLAESLGLTVVKKFTSNRKRKLRARLKEHGTDGWVTALDNVGSSAFLCGDPGPWRADFDFLMSPAKLLKVIEGGYNHTGGPPPTSPGPGWQEFKD